jgi:hypothetical protein
MVFFTAPFEAISTTAADPNNQQSVMRRIMDFLLPSTPVNSPPTVSADHADVSGNEGEMIANTGTWSDPDLPANTITLTASLGTVHLQSNGTWNWEVPAHNETPSTIVTITANDGAGGISDTSFQYSATNVAPAITADTSYVSGIVFDTLTNSGTWSDVPVDDVQLTASLGNVSKNADGTWQWSYAATSRLTNEPVTITASDGIDNSIATFNVTTWSEIVNGQVYYKGSTYSASGTNIEAALAPDKVLARAGAAPLLLSYANVINTTRGINGIVLDIAGLPAVSLAANDFGLRMSPQGIFDAIANPPSTWQPAPAPTDIAVSAGTATAPARVRLEWADNAIANRWLQLQVLPSANTGLLERVTLYLGHLMGDVDGKILAGAYFVQNADLAALAPIGGGATLVSDARDVDKNRFVLNSDGVLIRGAIVSGSALKNIVIPTAGSAAEGSVLPEGAMPLDQEIRAPEGIADVTNLALFVIPAKKKPPYFATDLI